MVCKTKLFIGIKQIEKYVPSIFLKRIKIVLIKYCYFDDKNGMTLLFDTLIVITPQKMVQMV